MLPTRVTFKSLRSSVPVVLVLMLGLLALACRPSGGPPGQPTTGAQAQATAAAPKVIRGGTIRTTGIACADLDLSKTWCSPHSDALSSVYDGLLHWRSDTFYDEAVTPGLAESWEISKDGLTYTFRIRKGMRFPNVAPVNGREFDASDVAFNIDMVQRDKRLVYPLYRWIDSYTMPDKYTIVIKLSKPYGPFLKAFGTAEAGIMFTREIYERDGNNAKDAIGVGPFYLKTWESNVKLETQRNPNYWETSEIDGKQLPYVDGYSLIYIRDDAGKLAAFRAKRLDQWYAFGSPPMDDVESLKRTNPDAVIVEEYAGGGTFGFNQDRPPFNNLKARQAAMYAVDKDAVIEQAWGKGARSEYFHPKSPLSWDEKTIRERLPYDPKKAKQLWDEAGLKDFRAVKVVARTEGSQGSADIKSAQVLVQSLNDSGIKAELMAYQDMAQSSQVNKAGEWDAGGFGPCASGAESNSQGTFGAHFQNCRSDNVNNYHGTRDPKVDQMQEDALFEADPDKAAAKWKALRDYVYENMYGFNYGVPKRWNVDQAWIHYKVKSRQHAGSRTIGMERAWLDEKYTGDR